MNQILDAIKNEKHVIDAMIMTDEMKKKTLEIEMKRLDELIPFINQGLEEAFQEEEAIVLIMDNDLADEERVDRSYEDDNTSFTLRTESGTIIGETITDPEELEDLRNDPDVYFLSDNFVTYQNLATPGEKQFFVITATNSDFFTARDLEGMAKSLKVAIPSTETDHYIRDIFNQDHDAKLGTLIVGYTL